MPRQLAVHEPSGLIVRFPLPWHPGDQYAPQNEPETATALIQAHGRAAAEQMLRRLIREAADVYDRAQLKARHQAAT